jgi:hypothetical protein
MRLSSRLFRWARVATDVEALASGRPSRILRRGKNRVLGRLMGRAGIWRRLWR